MFQPAIALAGIVIGTITDLKKREVPDWVNYGMMASGLGIAVMHSIYFWEVWFIVFSLAGLLVGYVLGALMYYTGQWGGGDAKMIMGIGALFGIPLFSWTEIPFFLLFLLVCVFAGAAYGMVWMIALFIGNRKKVLKRLSERLHTKRMMRLRIGIIIVAVLTAATGFLFPGSLTLMFVLLAALLYVAFYFSLLIKTVEETCFVKQRAVKDIVEGDWMVEEVKKGKKVLVPATPSGLTREQIAILKEHKVKEVTIKEGIPFVPSFLIAYLVTWYITHNNISVFFW